MHAGELLQDPYGHTGLASEGRWAILEAGYCGY